MDSHRKIFKSFITLFGCILLLAACGHKETVQLWASAPYRDKGDLYVTVYMYRQDGTKETCVEQIDRLSGQRIGFRDSQGYCYSVDRGGENNDSIVKLDSSGKTLYRAKLEGDRGQIKAFCEMADGRLAVLVNKSSGPMNYGLVLFDDKGKATNVELSGLTPGQNCYIGISEEGLLLVTEERLFRVVLPEGKLEPLFSFVQTAYAVGGGLQKSVVAFCLREDGKLEMLRVDQQGSGTCETLRLEEKSEDRQDVILRGWSVKNNSFAGKGPDILECNLIESPESLIEKGVLADLAPLMEQAGMKEEDYFPVTFDKWRTEGIIYSIRCSGSLMERTISSAVLGDIVNPDIEILVDALLAYPENAVYDSGFSADRILRELLEGSETLWGMVDWEKGTCDFDRELFRKLLEAARRYQYDAKNNYPVI